MLSIGLSAIWILSVKGAANNLCNSVSVYPGVRPGHSGWVKEGEEGLKIPIILGGC